MCVVNGHRLHYGLHAVGCNVDRTSKLCDSLAIGVLDARQHEICDRPSLQSRGMLNERLLLGGYPSLEALRACATGRGSQN